jgi:hypothetical protein
MESTRQMLGAMFIALGSAAGPAVLASACKTLTRAIAAEAVPDLYARRALEALVQSCDPSNHGPAA